jgi:hypothetical protein
VSHETARVGTPPQKRKASVQQPGLLLVEVAVSQAKHSAWIGTPTGLICRTRALPHSREGFRRFAQPRKDPLGTNRGRRLLIAMAQSGLYGQGAMTDCAAAATTSAS